MMNLSTVATLKFIIFILLIFPLGESCPRSNHELASVTLPAAISCTCHHLSVCVSFALISAAPQSLSQSWLSPSQYWQWKQHLSNSILLRDFSVVYWCVWDAQHEGQQRLYFCFSFSLCGNLLSTTLHFANFWWLCRYWRLRSRFWGYLNLLVWRLFGGCWWHWAAVSLWNASAIYCHSAVLAWQLK